ncbi:MAG: TfoX/Sxy family protein [Leptospiraceae bacterium]|nr:TfoX/Sxy family protein [Leptospiraceae bacterium]
MAADDEFISYLYELLEPMGDVHIKSMFGGHGVYHRGLMFGLVADDVLYLKVDAQNQPEFEARGMGPFIYVAKNKSIRMSYYQAPEECMDRSSEMEPWARSALAAAQRADAHRSAKQARSTKKTGKKAAVKKKTTAKKKAGKKTTSTKQTTRRKTSKKRPASRKNTAVKKIGGK